MPAVDTAHYQIGLYAHADAHWGQIPEIPGEVVFVDPGGLPQQISIDCLLVDIRLAARQVLHSAGHWQKHVPLLALVDPHQHFDEAFPFGCHIQEFITEAEIGSSLFRYKVSSAVRAYAKPLHLDHTSSPTYALLQEIVDHSSDWILIKDLDHRFMLASEPFAKSAGYDLTELLGKDDLQIGNSPEHVYGNPEKGWEGFWPQDDAVVRSGVPSEEENPHWDLYSKSERYRRTIRAPLRNHRGEIYSLLVCSQDITDQKKNESLLKERTDMLAQVTEEKRSAELNRRLAEEAVAAKSKFLAAASHDLRQPLHAMGLFLDILLSRTEGRPEQQLVRQVQQSCTNLSRLFNGCLDISRLDAGVVERTDEHFKVSGFLEGVNEELTQQALEKGLQYSHDIDESVVQSDSLLLGRIFRNLVTNAIQNTETGGISVNCRPRGNRVALAVSDTGKGIPAAERNRIFAEFHQVDSRDANLGRGLGLGLAIVKRLCELLDIEIELESIVGRGSTFTLLIPQGQISNIESRSDTVETLSIDGAVVLIIDDDKYIRHGMEALLQTHGCQTVAAADAALALEALQDQPSGANVPEIIVSDYHLAQGQTGTQAIERIRAVFGSEIPAVLVTGDTTSDSEQDAARFELRLLHKPVGSELLLSAISQELAIGST